jgi:hypothetical protein
MSCCVNADVSPPNVSAKMGYKRLPFPSVSSAPFGHARLPFTTTHMCQFTNLPPRTMFGRAPTTTINLTLSAVQSLPAPPPTSRKYRQMVTDITGKQYNPQVPQHRLLHIAYGRFAAMASHRKQLQQPPTSFQRRCSCGNRTRRLLCRRQTATSTPTLCRQNCARCTPRLFLSAIEVPPVPIDLSEFVKFESTDPTPEALPLGDRSSAGPDRPLRIRQV